MAPIKKAVMVYWLRPAGLALEVRIIFLEIVCGALALAFGRQLQLSDFGAEQDPHAIQFFVFSSR